MGTWRLGWGHPSLMFQGCPQANPLVRLYFILFSTMYDRNSVHPSGNVRGTGTSIFPSLYISVLYAYIYMRIYGIFISVNPVGILF